MLMDYCYNVVQHAVFESLCEIHVGLLDHIKTTKRYALPNAFCIQLITYLLSTKCYCETKKYILYFKVGVELRKYLIIKSS
jgi:hypothetical protein